MVVSNNKIVGINYSLFDDAHNLLDSNEGYAPLVYLHGAKNIIPGLESALEGMETAERKEISVSPENAYGFRDIRKVYTLLANEYDALGMVEGDSIRLSDGREAIVHSTSSEVLTVDENHPLAGMLLHFDITVVFIKEATLEEVAHGFPLAEANPWCCIPGCC